MYMLPSVEFTCPYCGCNEFAVECIAGIYVQNEWPPEYHPTEEYSRTYICNKCWIRSDVLDTQKILDLAVEQFRFSLIAQKDDVRNKWFVDKASEAFITYYVTVDL